MANKLTYGLCAAILIVTISLFTIGPAISAPEFVLAPRIRARDSNFASLNWSGYAVTGPAGSVSDAKGSWIVPAVTCSGTSSQYASFWVGIDGFSSGTVEQTGTDSDCRSGVPTYYAWFEFYPKPAFIINSLTISPGDVISADVNYAQGRFTVSIKDVTKGQSFSTSAKVSSAQRSSAEWIAEAPSSGGILPLANFGTVSLGQDYTAVSVTCYATVNGVTGPIGSFSPSVQSITMVTSSGAVKAQPSALTLDGTSFTVTFVSSGP